MEWGLLNTPKIHISRNLNVNIIENNEVCPRIGNVRMGTNCSNVQS